MRVLLAIGRELGADFRGAAHVALVIARVLVRAAIKKGQRVVGNGSYFPQQSGELGPVRLLSGLWRRQGRRVGFGRRRPQAGEWIVAVHGTREHGRQGSTPRVAHAPSLSVPGAYWASMASLTL